MSSRDINDCVPILIEFWPKLKRAYETHFDGRELFLTCTLRSVAEQQEIYAKNKPGSILTKCDGVKTFSKHNPQLGAPLSRAFDVAVKVNGKVVWDDLYYTPLAIVIDTLGYSGKIRWGGTFSFPDKPHFETI